MPSDAPRLPRQPAGEAEPVERGVAPGLRPRSRWWWPAGLVASALALSFVGGFAAGWLTHLQGLAQEAHALQAAQHRLAQEQAALAQRRQLTPPSHNWWGWWLGLGWHHLWRQIHG